MRRIYLLLTVVGLVVPYAFVGWFVASHGVSVRLFVRQVLATRGSMFSAADLLITGVVFLLFSYKEAQRVKMKRWWPYAVATVFVGPSFSIPLFLYAREKRFAPVDQETIGIGVQVKRH